MKVGFIGLGAMGAPMARYVHSKGLLTAVGNRTQAKADALAAELGVRAARSAANFADCDVVVLCVSLDADVLENVTALADVLKPGAVVIDHSTVAVDTARRAAAMLATHNIGFLDAPVSGGVEGARNGKLSVMVGGEIDTCSIAHAGDRDAMPRASPTWAARRRPGHQGGEPGAGRRHQRGRVRRPGPGREARPGSGQAAADADGRRGEQLVPRQARRDDAARRVQPGFKSAHMLKDLRIVQSIASGLRMTVIEQALADYAELIERGMGDSDTSALITLKRGG